ncbi:MAG: amidase [Thermoleophilales bacterium]|nr:amidase [Thermoleophilales bacterium]
MAPEERETPVVGMGAAEVAAAIRTHELTPSRAVEACIRRIEEVNPRLNAVVTPMFDRAREEAAAADRRIAEDGTGDLPPLFGVPITIKDCYPVDGVRFTAGSWFHRDDVARSDAVPVTRLREAGAIILGKTNIPDMCWGFESVNPVFGRTESARHPGFSAGGSSGGEASIIAAGGSTLGLGSDIGGSLRNPAANNGCVSLKPTTGRVPDEGHVPSVPAPVNAWNHAGPLARKVDDLAMALGVLDGSGEVNPPAIEGVRCRVFTGNRSMLVSAEVKAAVRRAAAELGSAGMNVEESPSLPIQRLGVLYGSILREYALPQINEQLGGGQRFSWPREMTRAIRGDARITREALTVYAYIAYGGILKLGPGDSLQKLEKLKKQVIDAVGDGVMICPLLLARPSRHGATWKPFTQIPMAVPFNMTGLPVVMVPVYWTANGLPLAVQVVAGPGRDELALAAARELEERLGGWRPID